MQSKPQGGNGVGYGQTWATYKKRIEDSNGFWLGLEEMHQLTKSGRYGVEILIELAAGSYDFVNWPLFVVGNEASKYKLMIGSDDGKSIAYSRNSGSGYNFASGTCSGTTCYGLVRFSTSDNDNDGHGSLNCARDSSYGHYTGWWHYGGTGVCSGYHWNKYRSGSNVYTGKKTRITMISRIGNCQPYQISLQMKNSFHLIS